MNASPASRRLTSEFAIGLMVCGAAYYFLVDPVQSRIARTRAEIEQVRQQSTGTPGIASLTDAQVAELRRVTAERAHEIDLRSRPARDEAAMFSAVMDLAARHAVRVDQLQPNGSTVLAPTASTGALNPPPDPSVPPDPNAPPQPKDRRVAYTVSASANYSDLAAFLHSLQHKLGYTVVKSVRCTLSGSETPDLVHAIIETEHFAFDLVGVDAQPIAPVAATPQPE